MFKNKKLRLFVIFLSLAIVLGIACLSLSVFSDNGSIHREGTTGTVAIELNSMINLLDEDGNDIMLPGCMRSCGIEVINQGNKSMDIKGVLSVTLNSETLTLSGDNTTQSEFEIYLRNDVEKTANGYVPKAGVRPLTTKSIDGNTITYYLPEAAISGNFIDNWQVEILEGKSYKYLYDYVLIFKNDCSLDWQDTNITIDVLIEGKQHNNTEEGWELIAHETVEQGVISKDTVVGEDIITNDDGNRK